MIYTASITIYRNLFNGSLTSSENPAFSNYGLAIDSIRNFCIGNRDKHFKRDVLGIYSDSVILRAFTPDDDSWLELSISKKCLFSADKPTIKEIKKVENALRKFQEILSIATIGFGIKGFYFTPQYVDYDKNIYELKVTLLTEEETDANRETLKGIDRELKKTFLK